MKPFAGIALVVAASLVAGSPARAEGYIAGKAEALPDLEIGLGESGLEKKGGDSSSVPGKGY